MHVRIFRKNIERNERDLDEISTRDLQRLFEDNKHLKEMHFQNGYFIIDWVRRHVTEASFP